MADSTFKNIPPSTGGGDSGVSSINSAAGDVEIVAGTNVTVGTVGNTITINSTGGGGGGITSINGDTEAAQTISSVVSDISTSSGSTIIGYKGVFYVSQVGSVATFDFNNGPSQWLDLSGDVTITLTNVQQGGAYVLGIAQNSSPNSLNWDTTVYWGDAGAPNITSMAHDAWIIINLWKDYYNRISGSYIMNYGP